jgi:hypothetical protein
MCTPDAGTNRITPTAYDVYLCSTIWVNLSKRSPCIGCASQRKQTTYKHTPRYGTRRSQGYNPDNIIVGVYVISVCLSYYYAYLLCINVPTGFCIAYSSHLSYGICTTDVLNEQNITTRFKNTGQATGMLLNAFAYLRY